jgi:3-oxoacyl-(acyl-carrier-protein) synthase
VGFPPCARGARIYAEVLGYGLNCDAHHQVAPERGSEARCMSLALRDAGVTPGDVDLISAHGTGTRLNDVTECGAVFDVFGPRPPRMVSVKSMLGHTMGAASALASAACVLGIAGGFIPPTINHEKPIPTAASTVCPIRRSTPIFASCRTTRWRSGATTPSSCSGEGEAGARCGHSVGRDIGVWCGDVPLTPTPSPTALSEEWPDAEGVSGDRVRRRGATRFEGHGVDGPVERVAVGVTAELLDKVGITGSVGVVLGTTSGSAQTQYEFTRDSLTRRKPYFVNPAIVPFALMNSAASQCAIWHGITGPNTTIAAGDCRD